MEQLDMDALLFPREEVDPKAFWCEWLIETHGCTHDVVAIVTRLFAEFGRVEGVDRARVLPDFCGTRRIDGLHLSDIERVGMFDHGIGYHQLWDRCWAMRQGLTLDEAARVIKWDYRRSVPVFMEVLA